MVFTRLFGEPMRVPFVDSIRRSGCFDILDDGPDGVLITTCGTIVGSLTVILSLSLSLLVLVHEIVCMVGAVHTVLSDESESRETT